MVISFRYSDHLKTLLANCPRSYGEEFVRYSLMLSIARLLEEKDHTQITVMDICEGARVARPTFYLYFSGKEHLFLEIAKDMTKFELELMPTMIETDIAFDGLIAICTWFSGFLKENIYLVQACAHYADVDPRLSQIWAEHAERKKTRLVRELSRFPKFPSENTQYIYFAIDTLARGINRLHYSIYGRNPGGVEETELPANPEYLPELCAAMIYQCVFCEAPPRDKFTPKPQMFRPIPAKPTAIPRRRLRGA